MPRRKTEDPEPRETPAALDHDPAWVARVREKLIAWHGEAGRSLPWRGDHDPYRVLVSEMMLVQTTVAAVVPYYERFLQRFPDVATLARADEAEVLKVWEGLGYYRRARQLQAAARAVVERRGGVFPPETEALRALPGVGRYIAGAVASFAFDRPEPIVEANTQRVLARWLALRGDLKTSGVQKRLWDASSRLVPPSGAGRFNQAFMDLGALVCTPREPRCLTCPVAGECQARALGLQDELPRATPKPPPLESVEACALVRSGGEFLVLQRGKGQLWEGFWEFPTVHVAGADPGSRKFATGTPVELAEGVRRLSGVDIEVGPVVTSIKYVVTRHKVRLDAHEARPSPAWKPTPPIPAAGMANAAWLPLESLTGLAFSAAGRRLLAWLSERGDVGPDGRWPVASGAT